MSSKPESMSRPEAPITKQRGFVTSSKQSTGLPIKSEQPGLPLKSDAPRAAGSRSLIDTSLLARKNPDTVPVRSALTVNGTVNVASSSRIEATPVIEAAAPIAVQDRDDFQPVTGTYIPKPQKSNLRLEEALDQLPEGVITGTTIQIFNRAELERISDIAIDRDEIEGNVHKSLNDIRMGCTSSMACGSCDRYGLDCPGHLGYIPLNRKFYHPMYINEIIDVLSSVCNSCGELLCSREYLKSKGILKKSGRARLKEIAGCNTRECTSKHKGVEGGAVVRCEKVPEYNRSKSKETGEIMYKTSTKSLSGVPQFAPQKIDKVIAIFRMISPQDAETLGFQNGSHPMDFIIDTITVLPPRARPNVELNGTVQVNAITKLYQEIIIKNNELAVQKNETEINRISSDLLKKIIKLINGSDSGASDGNREFKGIKQFIQSKEGLIRQNVQAKRVNFSARSVITPDPTVKFGQFSIPALMATKVTVPVRVAAFNQASLQTLLDAGKVKYITPVDDDPELRVVKGYQFQVLPEVHIGKYKLKIGDIVNRHMQDGDYAFFNRQPTCLV